MAELSGFQRRGRSRGRLLLLLQPFGCIGRAGRIEREENDNSNNNEKGAGCAECCIQNYFLNWKYLHEWVLDTRTELGRQQMEALLTLKKVSAHAHVHVREGAQCLLFGVTNAVRDRGQSWLA